MTIEEHRKKAIDMVQDSIKVGVIEPSPEMKALCSLTPGGSEFAFDYKNCVKYIQDKAHRNYKMIVGLAKERNALQKSNGNLIKALETCKDRLEISNLRYPMLGVFNIIIDSEQALTEAKGEGK